MLKFQSNILRSLTRFWWQPLSHDGVFKEHTDEKKKKMHYINLSTFRRFYNTIYTVLLVASLVIALRLN